MKEICFDLDDGEWPSLIIEEGEHLYVFDGEPGREGLLVYPRNARLMEYECLIDAFDYSLIASYRLEGTLDWDDIRRDPLRYIMEKLL